MGLEGGARVVHGLAGLVVYIEPDAAAAGGLTRGRGGCSHKRAAAVRVRVHVSAVRVRAMSGRIGSESDFTIPHGGGWDQGAAMREGTGGRTWPVRCGDAG
jgi:hypothetical protein